MPSLQPLIAYLQQRKEEGQTHIQIDEDSRKVLRKLYKKNRDKPTVEQQITAQDPVIHTSGTKSQRLATLKQQTEHWLPIKALGSMREVMVFSTGNPDANVLFVGEGPGYQEERQRQPFVGPSGNKLNQILKAMGITREEVYLTNICKFRPALPRQTTNNRKPSPEEIAASLPIIEEEIKIVEPKIIVALGVSAAEGLLSSQTSMGKLRGQWHEYQGLPLRITNHPSYLLNEGEEAKAEKRKVWEDMLAIMEKLNLPITEKQRNFFK